MLQARYFRAGLGFSARNATGSWADGYTAGETSHLTRALVAGILDWRHTDVP